MSNRSDPFTEMATRIDLNAEHGYGGAFVIVPPGEEVKPKHVLLLDNADNPAMFWSTLQTVCQMALQEIAQAEDNMGGFGRR